MMFAAATGLASCTAQSPKANMKSDVDTLSYMMGVSNTQGLQEYAMGRLGIDSTHMADFIRGIEEGLKCKTESLHGWYPDRTASKW